MSIEIDY